MVEALKKLASEKYRDFSMKLLPGINGEKVLGVRVPDIKSLAKEAVRKGGYESFLSQNHCYVEEVTLHGLILCYAKLPIKQLVVELEKLLPQIDNWGGVRYDRRGVKSRSTEQRSILRFVFEMVEFGRRLHRPLCDSAAAELLP